MEAIILLFIASIGILLVIAIILIEARNKKDYWTGVLVDKQITFYQYKNNKKTHYSLVFFKDSGKRIKYSVNKYQYNHYNVGDRVIKVQTKSLPSIIDENTGNIIENDLEYN